MKNINNNYPGRMLAGISTICHSRVSLSGISALEKKAEWILKQVQDDDKTKIKIKGGCMKNRAFTLIELLVVVLIIGILAAIALPQYQKAVTKARFAELKIMVKRVYDAQKVYYLANGKYSNRREELAVTLGPVTANTANYTIPFAHGHCGLEGSVNNEYPSAQNVYCSLKNPDVFLMFRLNTPTKICCNYEVNNHMLDQLCKDEIQATSLYGDSTKKHCYASSY